TSCAGRASNRRRRRSSAAGTRQREQGGLLGGEEQVRHPSGPHAAGASGVRNRYRMGYQPARGTWFRLGKETRPHLTRGFLLLGRPGSVEIEASPLARPVPLEVHGPRSWFVPLFHSAGTFPRVSL